MKLVKFVSPKSGSNHVNYTSNKITLNDKSNSTFKRTIIKTKRSYDTFFINEAKYHKKFRIINIHLMLSYYKLIKFITSKL